MSLEHSVPVLCFGEGKDLELSLCSESNSLPLATQVFHYCVNRISSVCTWMDSVHSLCNTLPSIHLTSLHDIM